MFIVACIVIFLPLTTLAIECYSGVGPDDFIIENDPSSDACARFTYTCPSPGCSNYGPVNSTETHFEIVNLTMFNTPQAGFRVLESENVYLCESLYVFFLDFIVGSKKYIKST